MTLQKKSILELSFKAYKDIKSIGKNDCTTIPNKDIYKLAFLNKHKITHILNKNSCCGQLEFTASQENENISLKSLTYICNENENKHRKMINVYPTKKIIHIQCVYHPMTR